VPTRLRRIRRELDEVAEQLDRLATAIEPELLDGKIELVGMQEVEKLAGVARSTLRQWKLRGKLPEPAAELACGTVWLKADIEQWLRSR